MNSFILSLISLSLVQQANYSGVCLTLNASMHAESCEEYSTEAPADFLQRMRTVCKNISGLDGKAKISRSWLSTSRCERKSVVGICHLAKLQTNRIFYSEMEKAKSMTLQEICEGSQGGTWESFAP